MQEYKITDDGFGIHTFELSISYMQKKEMNVILEHMREETINRIYYDDNCVIVYTKYPCLRIYLNQKKHMRYIRVVVTANKVLHPEADYLSILNGNDDVDLLGMELDDMLTDIFGVEYGLDKFSLSRIDCCVNIMLSKDFSAERYVKLISRSLKCKPDKIKRYDGDNDLSKNRNKHSFCAETSLGTFTAYDKYFQLDDIDLDYDAISDALLRIELKIDRRKMPQIIKDNLGKTGILEFYLHNCRKYFEDFISSKFNNGRYYTVEKMREIIANSDLKSCEKSHAQKHIDAQYNFPYYGSAMLNSKK